MKLEKLKIIDSVNNKTVHVMVTPELAKKCRTDSGFVMNLLNNVKAGNYTTTTTTTGTPQKSEVAKEETFESPEVKCLWNNFETLKLIDTYTKYKRQFQVLPRRIVWTTIADELAKDGIQRTPEKCDEKWRNLIRTFKAIKNSDRRNFSKFVFYDAVEAAMNAHGLNLLQCKNDSFNSEWTYEEAKALIDIYEENEDEINVKNKEWSKFWITVSERLQERGIDKEAVQCEEKWKQMEEQYTKFKRGDDSEQFEFSEEFDRIFGDNIPDEELFTADVTENDSTMVNSTANTELLEAFDKFTTAVSDQDKSAESDGNEKEDSTNYIKREKKSNEDVGFIERLLNDTEGQDSKVFWERDETIKLIRAYTKHKENFKKSSKKRNVWKAISDELAAENISKSADKCEIKWKNLLRTYKRLNRNCLYDSKATRFSFYQEIDDAIAQEDVTSDTNENGNHTTIKEEKNSFSESMAPWTYTETKALLEVYEKHRNGNKFNFSLEFWKAVSDELAKDKGIAREPKHCEQKLKNLKMQYKLNLSNGSKFKFFDELSRIFQNAPKQGQEVDSPTGSNDEEPKKKKVCRCRSERDSAKQKRHEEKMGWLKKKIELEERKVQCFERYVEYLQKKENDGDLNY